MSSWIVHAKAKGFFAGSGSDCLSEETVVDSILKLVDDEFARDVIVGYLGTATYDQPLPQEKQTKHFISKGCKVEAIKVALGKPLKSELAHYEKIFESCDILIVSGGNTLYAVDAWERYGFRRLIKKCYERGCILTGGSAGMIAWFDAGHSDSMDPASYRSKIENFSKGVDESQLGEADLGVKNWKYIRVPGLGLFPGLACPHYDKVQSNGVLRAHDFDLMIQRHSNERGICVDHWAALVVTGEDYHVYSTPNKPGSLLPDGSLSDIQAGTPACWIKEEITGNVKTTLLPLNGKVKDILRSCKGKMIEDPLLELARKQNPYTE